ncbi:hypothetical protein ACJBPY_10835, partial [Streptococcus suis]
RVDKGKVKNKKLLFVGGFVLNKNIITNDNHLKTKKLQIINKTKNIKNKKFSIGSTQYSIRWTSEPRIKYSIIKSSTDSNQL